MQSEYSKIKHHDFALGRQMTVEYYECDPAIIGDGEKLEKIFLHAAKESGAHIISSDFHSFEPQGVSGVVIISESHFTVHAWPEHDYAAVDIFTCGENIDFDVAIKSLQDGMRAEATIVSGIMNRGIVGNNGVERLVPVFADREHRYNLSWESYFKSIEAGGISCTIDLYNIFGGQPFDVSDVRGFAARFIEKNTVFGVNSSISSYHFRREGADVEIIFLHIEDGIRNACGRFFPEQNKLYLDIFSPTFFEPRPVAELLVSELDAVNYRMQVGIRR